MRPAAVALVALVAFGCGDEGGRRDVRLRFHYDPGDTLAYEYHTSGTATVPDSAEAGATTERPYERRLRIDEIATDVTPGGDYVLELVYRAAPDSAPGSGAAELIRLSLEITPQGKVVDVSGVETSRPRLGGIDFQSYFEQSQPVFPERPLTVGDSWTQEVKVVSSGSEPVTTSSTYVLDSLAVVDGRPTAVIDYDGDIYLPATFSAADSAGGRPDSARVVSAEERIRVRGRIWFDHERGVVRRIENRAEATFVKVRLQAGRPVRREMRIREQSEMRLLDR